MAICLGKYLVVDRIEFIVTYLCNSSCSHCQLGEEEKWKRFPNHVDKDMAVDIVRKVGQAYTPRSIMTFGGEPLLYPDIVYAIHRQARKMGIPRREIITNGFWSTRTERIQEIARRLAKCGVNDVGISVDVFHQEFIPLKTVKKTATSLIEAGIERVEWNPCWVVSKNHDNKYNRRTKAILQKLHNPNVKEGEGNYVRPEGRALSHLAEFLPPRTLMPKEKCGEIPYTEKLDSVKTISIEPDGRVAVCQNFHIGNAHESDIIDILENYDPFKIPEALSIIKKGMNGLTEWAKQRDVEPRPEGYYNICHMCTDLRERTRTTCSNSSRH